MSLFIWIGITLVVLIFMYLSYNPRKQFNLPKEASLNDPNVQHQAALEAEKQIGPIKWALPFVAAGFVLWAILEFVQQTTTSLILGASFICFALLCLLTMYSFKRDATWRRSKFNVYTWAILFFAGIVFVFASIAITKAEVPLASSDWIWAVVILIMSMGSWYFKARN